MHTIDRQPVIGPSNTICTSGQPSQYTAVPASTPSVLIIAMAGDSAVLSTTATSSSMGG